MKSFHLTNDSGEDLTLSDVGNVVKEFLYFIITTPYKLLALSGRLLQVFVTIIIVSLVAFLFFTYTFQSIVVTLLVGIFSAVSRKR